MKKVKEEFLLSMIFVAKWLLLGLGSVGVLYVAIYFAYYKSYYDPRLEKYDYEILVLHEQKENLVATVNALDAGLMATQVKISKIKLEEMPSAEIQISKDKLVIDELGLNWWEKITSPMLNINSDVEAAYVQLKNSEKIKSNLNLKLNQLNGEHAKSNRLKINIADDIRDYDLQISETERDKKRFEVDVKGPMLWLAGVLGLT